ncbi:hypothetical protein LIER_42188 [Lithospermum erythrorhizon]|uniref:Uncharacterized protein n=1 Tax=Lithospermum erythrorhizon TaxID=34254 RepID=A0AAV3RMS6_LITER
MGRISFSQIVDELALRGMPATQLDIWMMSRNMRKAVNADSETTDLYEFLTGTMNGVPVEETTADFRGKLYQDVVRKDKSRTVTCVGHGKLDGDAASFAKDEDI